MLLRIDSNHAPSNRRICRRRTAYATVVVLNFLLLLLHGSRLVVEAFATYLLSQSNCWTELNTDEVIMNHHLVAATDSDDPSMRIHVVDHAGVGTTTVNTIHNGEHVYVVPSFPHRLSLQLLTDSDKTSPDYQYVMDTTPEAEFVHGVCEHKKRIASKSKGIVELIISRPNATVVAGWATGHEPVRLTPLLRIVGPTNGTTEDGAVHGGGNVNSEAERETGNLHPSNIDEKIDHGKDHHDQENAEHRTDHHHDQVTHHERENEVESDEKRQHHPHHKGSDAKDDEKDTTEDESAKARNHDHDRSREDSPDGEGRNAEGEEQHQGHQNLHHNDVAKINAWYEKLITEESCSDTDFSSLPESLGGFHVELTSDWHLHLGDGLAGTSVPATITLEMVQNTTGHVHHMPHPHGTLVLQSSFGARFEEGACDGQRAVITSHEKPWPKLTIHEKRTIVVWAMFAQNHEEQPDHLYRTGPLELVWEPPAEKHGQHEEAQQHRLPHDKDEELLSHHDEGNPIRDLTTEEEREAPEAAKVADHHIIKEENHHEAIKHDHHIIKEEDNHETVKHDHLSHDHLLKDDPQIAVDAELRKHHEGILDQIAKHKEHKILLHVDEPEDHEAKLEKADHPRMNEPPEDRDETRPQRQRRRRDPSYREREQGAHFIVGADDGSDAADRRERKGEIDYRGNEKEGLGEYYKPQHNRMWTPRHLTSHLSKIHKKMTESTDPVVTTNNYVLGLVFFLGANVAAIQYCLYASRRGSKGSRDL